MPLTEQQEQVIDLFANRDLLSDTEIAQRVPGINTGDISRWLTQPDFLDALDTKIDDLWRLGKVWRKRTMVFLLQRLMKGVKGMGTHRKLTDAHIEKILRIFDKLKDKADAPNITLQQNIIGGREIAEGLRRLMREWQTPRIEGHRGVIEATATVRDEKQPVDDPAV